MKPRFLLDGMLGSLSRWLRICGYDAVFMENASDQKLVEKARRTRRALLTRDKELTRIAQRAGVESLLVEGEDDAHRLRDLSERLGLKLFPDDSRCPKCNGLLDQVDKGEVKGIVPPGSYDAFNEFWRCRSCGGVFWRGSHWGNITETLRRAREGSP